MKKYSKLVQHRKNLGKALRAHEYESGPSRRAKSTRNKIESQKKTQTTHGRHYKYRYPNK